MIGISSTTTGVLLRKADSTAAPSATSARASRGCIFARAMMRSATRLITPVRISDPDSTNIAPTVSGALLEKTEKSDFSLSRPNSANAQAPTTAITVGE